MYPISQQNRNELLRELLLHCTKHPLTKKRLAGIPLSELHQPDSHKLLQQVIPKHSECHHKFTKLIKQNTSSIMFSTSGSTGKEKYIALSFEEMLENTRHHGFAYQAAGITRSDRVATFGMPSLLTSELTVHLALANTGCQILPIGQATCGATIFRLISELHANVLLVMPSDLHSLLDYMEEEKYCLPQIRLIVTGGEKLQQSLKRRIMQLCGNAQLKLSSTFQTADTGTIGYQCRYCVDNEYHIQEKLQYAEILASGELVITNLKRRQMPVLRILTGDQAIWSGTPCLCGDQTAKILLKGRAAQNTKIGGEKIPIDFFDRLMESFSLHPHQFAVHIVTHDSGRDQICLKIHDRYRSQFRKIQAWLLNHNSLLREKIAVHLVEPYKIDILQAHDLKRTKSGKFITIQDNRP